MVGGVNAGVAEFTLRYATSRVVLYMRLRRACGCVDARYTYTMAAQQLTDEWEGDPGRHCSGRLLRPTFGGDGQ